ADIRSSYDGNAWHAAFRIFGTGVWKCFDDLVEQVAGTGAVFSRDGEYVAQAELIEFSGEGCFTGCVGFVGGDVNRLVGCAYDVSVILVEPSEAVAHIDDEFDFRLLFDGKIDLYVDVGFNLVLGSRDV